MTRFAGELRQWRDRRGVSQLDLAVRAGTTQRHLSFIERGRSAPGRTMVVRLAESLELTLRESNSLLLAAGYAPLFPESDLSTETLRPVREALDTILAGHDPYPAVVVRADGEIVAANASMELLFEDVDAALLEHPMNAFRIALHPDGMAPRISNFAEWAQHVLNAMRTTARRSPGAGLDQLLNELERYVPAHVPGPDHLGFAVPLSLASADGEVTLMTTLMSFATATDVTLADLNLEAFLPVDAKTAQILRDRAERRRHRDRLP